MSSPFKALPLDHRGSLAVVLGSFLLLCGMVAASPPHLCYDEHFHLDLAQRVHNEGWRAALTSPENESSAGPLFPAIHLALTPLTARQAPAVRWVNVVCLVAIVAVLMSQVPGQGLLPWAAAASILAVPYLWPAAGMALTELPALAAFTAFITAFLRLIALPAPLSAYSLLWAMLAGLFLGLAILGRQTYLVAIPAVAAMAFWLPKKWPLLLACLAIALLGCSWLFILWGGLVPPFYKNISSGLRLENGVLSLCYCAAATLFLSPRSLKPRNFRTAIVCLAAGIVLGLLARNYADPPAKTLLIRLLGEQNALLVGFVIGCALAVLAVAWCWNLFEMIWQNRRDPGRLFILLTLLGLAAAPMRVTHQFSSRYVVGLLTVLFLALGVPRELDVWWGTRTIAGSLVGAAILWTYFH